MSERYQDRDTMSYSDNFLLMSLSAGEVIDPHERSALENWKLLEVKANIKNEQLMLLRYVVRNYQQFAITGEDLKQCTREATKYAKAVDSCMREETKLRTEMLGPLARRISQQVSLRGYYRPEVEAEHVRSYEKNYAQARDKLYNREVSSTTGIQNKETADSSLLIRVLDIKITEVQQRVNQVENELANLKWCISREKREYKQKLSQELLETNNYLASLREDRKLWMVIR